jgi:hypothetical protein
MVRVGCARGELDRVMAELDKQPDPGLNRRVTRMFSRHMGPACPKANH